MEPAEFKKKFEQIILRRFFSRWHMTLIVLASLSAGIVTSKLLLSIAEVKMLARYPISILVSYLVFLIGLKVWLSYAGLGKYLNGSVLSKREFEKDKYWLNSEVLHSHQDRARSVEVKVLDKTFSVADSSLRAGIDIGSIGFGEASEVGCLVALVGILIYFLTLTLYAAGLLVIMEAPAILAEIVFEAALAAGLVRLAKRQTANGWLTSAFSITWPSFAFVTICAILFALIANKLAPEANSISEIAKIMFIKYGKS
jgi:hypothetical protein